MITFAAKDKMIMRIKSTFMSSVIYQDYTYFERPENSASNLQERINSDVNKVTENIMGHPKEVIMKIIEVCIRIAYAATLAPMDTIFLSVLPLPLLALANYKIEKFRSKHDDTSRKIREAGMASTMEVLSNPKTVRSFIMENEEAVAYSRSIAVVSKVSTRTTLITVTVGKAFWAVFVFNLGFINYLVAKNVADGTMDANNTTVFMITIAFHVLGSINDLMRIIPELIDMMKPLGRIANQLAAASTIEPNPNDPTHCPLEVVIKSDQELEAVMAQLSVTAAGTLCP